MLPDFLDCSALRLLCFGGKGGVGKTTCAAATGLRLATCFPERHYLLASTDPAHSLADSLAGCAVPRNLKVLELDAAECLDAFRAEHGGKLRDIAARGTFLDDQDLNRILELSLPGLDELMAFLEISRCVEQNRWDCVLVDTAPSGHTLRMLQVPELLRRWLGALDSLLAKHRYLRQVFGRSSRPDELDEFLRQLGAAVTRIEALVRDAGRCLFVPVLVAETLSVRETAAMLEELQRLGWPVTDVIVNRLHPDNRCPACADSRLRQQSELGGMMALPEFSACRIWGVPLYPEEVRGRSALAEFWREAVLLGHDPAPPQRSPSIWPPLIEQPDEPLAPEPPLLVIAGKGGVGKTTLACATAAWLAREHPGSRVLLFSADPAHALANCLDVSLDGSPTPVAPGLDALEIDACAEFASLRDQYAEEVQEYLAGVTAGCDLTFDREAFEKLLDLAPPGLDEIMALSRVMEFLAAGRYDFYVLDSAATGHLVRLLELPSLIEQWLAVFFELFLKYEPVFRLPRFAGRLVELSKNVKRLRKLLADPAGAQIYAVAIPTEMALEETKDLMAACRRMGVRVPAIFLNLLTRSRTCSLCAAVHRREQAVQEKFEAAFPRQRLAVIYQQGELRGLARLVELGAAMYQPAGKESVSRAS